MLGMSKANGADTRPGRSGFRPRHWAQAQAENPLARFIPFSSLVSPARAKHRGRSPPSACRLAPTRAIPRSTGPCRSSVVPPAERRSYFQVQPGVALQVLS